MMGVIDQGYWTLVVMVLVALATGVGYVAFVTHRIFGPMVSIERFVRQLATSDIPVSPLRLRKGDSFEELARLLNDVRDARAAELKQKQAAGDG